MSAGIRRCSGCAVRWIASGRWRKRSPRDRDKSRCAGLAKEAIAPLPPLWRYWCAGGCPVATFAATGRYDVKSPNCGIYKAIYPEALKLEGLRLLKYGGTTI